QTLIGDKNYFGRDFERELAQLDIQLLRPTRKGERQRPGGSLFKPLRQVNETFKGQLDLEQHRGCTPGGVVARVFGDKPEVPECPRTATMAYFQGPGGHLMSVAQLMNPMALLMPGSS
ncbi:hypothetical protein ACI2L2_40280, partial [Streptomyces sp. NPDC030920]